MEKWKIDVAVLCIFFARPEQFKKSFEQVKKAKPRVLLLWQDGPREGREDDIENIKKCREIAEDIDWECEVHKNYHEKNMGCDPSTFYSHKWAFSLVDKCIILEDDLVASLSFFSFCKVMLDLYENDTRIDRICGTNLLGHYDIPYDYFFSTIGNSWGWATWKRVAETWDENYAFMELEYEKNCMRALQPNVKPHLQWEKECLMHKKEGVPYWEHIIGARNLLNHGLVIYPRVNMIQNIGLDINSTHAPKDLAALPKRERWYFENKAIELIFPLKHPKYFIEDVEFCRRCRKKTKGNRLLNIFERIKIKLKKLFRKK